MSTNKKDYYEILGLNKNASKIEIKKAYKKKAMQFHPDRNKEPGAEDKFKEATEAYEILSDEQKKAQYDQFGHSAFGQGHEAGFGGFDFNFGNGFADIFSEFFGGFGSRKNRAYKGENLRAKISISLRESYFGKKFKQKLYKWENEKKIKKEIEITIPEGIRSNQDIVIKGFGEKGINGGPNGDFYIRVIVEDHKLFYRHDYDLVVEVPVSVFDILSEKELDIPVFDSIERILLTQNIQQNHSIRISKKGFKAIGNNYVGDLVFNLKIYIPKMNSKIINEINEISKKITDKKFKNWKKKL